MRASSLFRSTTAGLSAVLLGSVFQQSAHGLSFKAVSNPHLDLSPLGQVALTGDFDAVSIYSYEEQSETTSLNNGSQSLLTTLPNGMLTSLSTADAHIRDMCPFTQKDGTYKGLFVGGNFTSLGGVEAQGVAMFDPDTQKVTALPGLRGSVSALLCDRETNSVYVGGDFKYKNTSNAAAWSDGSWKSLSFGGFNGPVSTILKDQDGHIIFGGEFDGIGNSTSSKKGQQLINLQTATVTSDAESSRSGFSDPRNVICQTSGDDGEGKTWLLTDNAPGFWRADMKFEYFPTKFRLYNTHLEGRGTKTFLFRVLPDNGIMNLTYTDPDSHEKAYCDQHCPLSSSKDEKYREFHLVNPVGMQGFMIEIQDWYGDGAGLNGIEVFTNDIFSYAVDDFNEPSCGGIEFPSKSTRKGSWSVKNSDQSSSQYLTAQVSNSDATSTSVQFEPDIKRPGNYSVIMYTPGCTQDGTCNSRGIVNVTASVSSDAAEPVSTQIYQTNLYDKYDTIYTGHVDASEDSFRPSVTLTPIAGQGDVTVVASRVKFGLIHATGSLSGELNGLYDFDPSTKSTETDFTKSAVNRAGLKMHDNASIMTLTSHDSVIYAGGNFSSSDIKNIFSLELDGNATALPGQGLNSEVVSLAVLDKFLYVGGNFTDTSDGGNSDLKHVAAYSFDSKKWSALGGGVNGPVDKIIPLSLNVSSDVNETIVAVSGEFGQLLSFGDSPPVNVSGFGVWVPSKKKWLQNLDTTQMEFSGEMSAYTKVANTTVLAGNLASGGLGAAGAVALHSGDEVSLDPLLSNTDSSGATYTGVYDTTSGRNLTILGGHFMTTASDGSTIENVAILDGKKGTISGIGSGIDSNSTFLAFAVSNDRLYAGGNVTGAVGKQSLNGMVVYDLENKTIADEQPALFKGKNVSVNSIAARPSSKEIYVGGQFESAGALPCPGVCYYDVTDRQWNRPGSLYGSVLDIRWMNHNKLLAVGNMDVEGNQTVVATYTVKGQTWKSFDGASKSDFPGTVTAFTPSSTDVSTFWLAGQSKNGSSFLSHYDGSKFQFTSGNLFSEGTNIHGLEVLPMSSGHGKVNLLSKDQIVLVTGQLVIPDFGNASAALFNGTDVTPFILSTSDGQPGTMSRMFYENKNPYTTTGKHHSNGIVVLVSFCCALGCVFLIVIAGIIFNKIQRRRQGYMAAPQAVGTDRPTNMQRLPPEYLFNSLSQPNPAAPAI